MIPSGKITVSIDSGGTFTDCIVRQNGAFLRHFKVPSTPEDPARAIISVIDQLNEQSVGICRHGTTVGTNGILERSGGRVAFITNEGLEDCLKLKRQARPNLYDLEPVIGAGLISDADILSIPWRRGVDGKGIGTAPDWNRFITQNQHTFLECDAVAICFLHACSFPEEERALRLSIQAIYPEMPVSISSEISALEREYERACSTVINAYLQPLVSTYVGKVNARLGSQSDLQVMTSAGGLVPYDHVQRAPIQTVLSGPAGGFLGAAAAGQRLGYDSILSLDMGGTSTDVALISSDFDLKTNHEIMHMPVVTPMLPIETVGAGGGSIAFVDTGGILKVGPESAGANPGPACYGMQAELERWCPTVTDAHIVLGHISELLGGDFQLFRDHAYQAMKQLAEELNASVEETARAVIATCTETMARACRRVSLEQGIDTRHVALVAFGGAGGLHACELADALGCKAVIFPARAGVLSAQGIALAPNREVTERTIHLAEDAWDLETFKDLQRCPDVSECTTVSWVVLCRLTGQDHTLSIEIDLDTTPCALRRHFEIKFKKRYGFSPSPSHPLELTCLRMIVTQNLIDQSPQTPTDCSIASVLSGPQVIATYDATLWLPNGWSASKLTSGDIICEQTETQPRIASGASVPLGLEIHHQKLMSIAEEMGRVLQDTSLSANIRERRDFSCAIFDKHGKMLAHAAHIPVHLGATPLSVSAVIDHCNPQRDADYILNNPFAGGTHLPDVTIVRPIFLGQNDQASFYVANRAHHSDVGGVTPGSLPVATREAYPSGLTIHDEGVCIDPCLLDDEVFERFTTASRLPDERRADLAAQVAANVAAQSRISQWVAGSDLEHIHQFNQSLLDYSTRITRQWLDLLPDQSVNAIEYLESDGLSDAPIKLSLNVSKTHSGLTFDFTQSDDSTPSSLNAVAAITRSAVFYVLKLLVPSTPANDGVMEDIEVLTRLGSVVDAQSPSAVSAGNVETSQRLVDTILSAFSQLFPHRVPAQSCGSMNNVLMGGFDHRGSHSTSFVHYETLGGGAGGGPSGRGADGIHVHMTNTLNTPIEVFERRFPVQIPVYKIRSTVQDTQSAQPGGRGIERHYRFMYETEVTVIAERHTLQPKGLFGGLDGVAGFAELKTVDGHVSKLPSKFTRTFAPGETLIIGTANGGGWGLKV